MEVVLSVSSVNVDIVASLVSVVEARNGEAPFSGWRSVVWTGLVAVSGMTIVGTERTARYVLRVSGGVNQYAVIPKGNISIHTGPSD